MTKEGYGYIFRLESRAHGREDIECDNLQEAIACVVSQRLQAAELADGLTRTASVLRKTFGPTGARGLYRCGAEVVYKQKTKSAVRRG